MEEAWLVLTNNQALSGYNITLLVFSFVQSLAMFAFAIALHLCSRSVSAEVRELGEEGRRLMEENPIDEAKSPPVMGKEH